MSAAANARVVKNLLMTVASEGVGGVLSFVIVLFSARLLGVESFGVFSYILAITGICQLVADFGLTSLVVREIARERERAAYIMSNVMSLAWLMAVVILVVIVGVAWLTLNTAEERQAAVLMAVAVLAIYHAVVYSSVCRAFEQMQYNAICFVLHKVVLLGLIFWLAGDHSPIASPLVGIATAYLGANLLQYLYFLVVVRQRLLRFGLGRDWRYCRRLIAAALPVGTSMVIRRLTLHVDILLLSLLATPAAVGIFSAAYKVVQMTDMIPFALCLPLFPAFSRLAAQGRDALQPFFQLSMRGFLILAIPCSGLLLVTAPGLVNLAYGEDFLQAVNILLLLSLTVVCLFINMLLSQLFMATHHTRFYVLAAGACLLINALVDVALIPSLGAMGAAIGTLLGELCYLLLCVGLLKKVGMDFPWLRYSWGPLLSAALAGLLAFLVAAEGWLGLAVQVAVFALVYLLGLVVFGVLRPAEIKRLSHRWTGRGREDELLAQGEPGGPC